MDDGNGFEGIKRRYADSLWLRSERTILSGPVRNDFDPDPHDIDEGRTSRFVPRPERYRVTVTAASGAPYTVETYGRVDVLLFENETRLVIFSALFGESLASFAVVSGVVERTPPRMDVEIKADAGAASRGLERIRRGIEVLASRGSRP